MLGLSIEKIAGKMALLLGYASRPGCRGAPAALTNRGQNRDVAMSKRKAPSDEQSIEFAFRLQNGQNISFVLCHLPGMPVGNALQDACGDRWNRLVTLLAKLQARPEKQTPQARQQVVQLAGEFLQLAGWVLAEYAHQGIMGIARLVEKEAYTQLNFQAGSKEPRDRPKLRVKIVRVSRENAATNFVFGTLAVVAETHISPRPGRPTTLREPAIRALELRLQDEKCWPWSRLARSLPMWRRTTRFPLRAEPAACRGGAERGTQ